MLHLDNLDPVEVAVAIFNELEYENQCTDEETVHALVPGKWGKVSLMVWHDFENEHVNFFAALDNLKISKRRTTAILRLTNQLNTGLQIGTVSYAEEAKRIQFKYVLPTDNNNYIDPGVIEKVIVISIKTIEIVHFQCMMVASGECKHDQISDMMRIHSTAGTA
jgi:hypothetical protein